MNATERSKYVYDLGAKHGSEVNKVEAGLGMEIIGLEVPNNH